MERITPSILEGLPPGEATKSHYYHFSARKRGTLRAIQVRVLKAMEKIATMLPAQVCLI
ncbi:hypothetical protein BGS_0888 [Beggiatoa sp. SS]|nr:hypothetical protein BGS_0888 [Beggiatoa sp. SS]